MQATRGRARGLSCLIPRNGSTTGRVYGRQTHSMTQMASPMEGKGELLNIPKDMIKDVSRISWRSLNKQREFFNDLAKQKGFTELADWYAVSRAEVIKAGGANVFKFHPSLDTALRAVYPEFQWESARFTNKNKHAAPYDLINPLKQRELLDTIGRALGVSELEDWYKISKTDVKAQGGKGLFKHYSSLEAVLKSLYPDYGWDSSRFVDNKMASKGYWSILENQKNFIEDIAPLLGVKELSDWYKIAREDVSRKGGRTLWLYHQSLEGLVRTLYPDYPWQSAKFVGSVRSPAGYWQDVNNQREAFEELGKKLGFTKLSDWYTVNRKVLTGHGLEKVLKHYPSLPDALKAIYPDYPWKSIRFYQEAGKAPPGHWNNPDNILELLTNAESQLGITKPEDWYSVTLADLHEIGLPKIIKRQQLAELLNKKYPDYQWEKVILLKGRFAQQRRLERALASIFKGVDIQANVRKEADLVDPSNAEYLELDIYIPSLQLAFEYQERHHYIPAEYNYKPLDQIKERDETKRLLAAKKGITLVPIPCWWDNTKESLIATIKKVRPDLLTDVGSEASPIPTEMPPNYLDKQKVEIPDIGEPTTATFFTITNIDPTNWWMFEKYDGVRGFWNPNKKAFYSRKGNLIAMPKEIVDSMPTDIFLDGELWFGRDNFQETLRMTNKADNSDMDWKSFRYVVFDVPTHVGSYEERFSLLVELVNKSQCKCIQLAEMEKCRDIQHMETFFQDVIDKGGEGIILRDPKAKLQPGRSYGYLKHKKFRDAEAKVVRKVGQFEWECEMPNGARFTAPAGTGEFLKRWDPKPGDIVSFKHHGFLLASKRPKLPTLYRMREDLSWADVVNNWKEQKSSPKVLPIRKTKVGKTKGFWLKRENRRAYFLDYAKQMGFDPFIPENWQKVTAQQIKDKMGIGPMSKFEGSMKLALEDSFPELTFSFKERKANNYWRDINNCRKFLDEWARERGHDPLDPITWYSLSFKRSHTMFGIHGGLKALLHKAYPEINFDGWNTAATLKWFDIANCRKFFDEVAQKHGFNPLNPDGWYSLDMQQMKKLRGGSGISAAQGGFKKALIQAYPEVQFTKWQK